MNLYKIEDGATTWVAAKHPGEAVRILAETHGMTREQYAKEWPEHEVTKLAPYEAVTVRLDVPTLEIDPVFTRDLPRHRLEVSVCAIVCAKDVVEPGILCCTEW